MTAGLFLWCFGEAIFCDRMFAWRDAAHFYYPLFQFVQDQWSAGQLPRWNPYENAGAPLLADPAGSVAATSVQSGSRELPTAGETASAFTRTGSARPRHRIAPSCRLAACMRAARLHGLSLICKRCDPVLDRLGTPQNLWEHRKNVCVPIAVGFSRCAVWCG